MHSCRDFFLLSSLRFRPCPCALSYAPVGFRCVACRLPLRCGAVLFAPVDSSSLLMRTQMSPMCQDDQPAPGAKSRQTDLVLPLGISNGQKNGRLGSSVHHIFEHVVLYLHIQLETKASNNQRNFGLVLRKALDNKANFKLLFKLTKAAWGSGSDHNVPNEVVQP